MNIKPCIPAILLLCCLVAVQSAKCDESQFQLERQAERDLETALQPRFSDSAFRNAGIATGIASALKEMARVKGGNPENYIPREYRNSDKETLIKKALEMDENTPSLIGYAVSQNPTARGADSDLKIAVKQAAIRDRKVRIYSSAEIQTHPELPIPTVPGKIESVTMYGNFYTAKTTDGVVHEGTIDARIDEDGCGRILTMPSGSSSVITTLVSPTSRTVIP